MFSKFSTLAVFLFVLVAGFGFGQMIVKADLDASEYKIGDLVKVQIKLENNPGLHNVFFDLTYDGDVLSFDDVRNGSVVYNFLVKGELLYADNNENAGFASNKIVVSFSLKGSGIETRDNGCLVELSFRVIGIKPDLLSFDFASHQALDGDKQQLTTITWRNSPKFTVKATAGGEFILIKKPYDNEVFYTIEAPVSLICTEGDYLVKLTNSSLLSYDSGFIQIMTGRLLDYDVPLVSGMNRINAELYNPGTPPLILKKHSVRVYKSPDSEYVTITDPKDHSLLNTDMVSVRVLSPLDHVEVNGITAAYYGENEGPAKVYYANVWLSAGFNTITAVAQKNPPQNVVYQNITSTWFGVNDPNNPVSGWLTDNSANWSLDAYAGMFLEIGGSFAKITGNSTSVLWLEENSILQEGAGFAYRIRSSRENEEAANLRFTHSIQVYYQKDSSIFNFIQPQANQGFKPSEYTQLLIKGEINSLYKTSNDPASGGPVENAVTLDVKLYPSNRMIQPITVVANQHARIRESDYEYGTALSKYVFENGFDIPLKGLPDGELEITAYKNKTGGTTWDDKITRICYVDDQRLWINLVQPNIFTFDSLDSRARIENFNETHPINAPQGAVVVTNEGEIGLTTEDEGMIEQLPIDGMCDIVEAPDGILYGLVNTSTSLVKIYKREPGQSAWTLLFSKSGIYGYSLCYTDIGLFLGVSNIPANGNSGLYLVSGTNLVNVDFSPEQVAHAQFVSKIGSVVYVYGSLFSHIYSFETRTIEEQGGKLKVTSLTKTPLASTYNLRSFSLSSDGTIAIARTDEQIGNIRIFKKGENGFCEVTFPCFEGSSAILGKSVISGLYEDSEYNAYVIPIDGNYVEVLMENKARANFFRRRLPLIRDIATPYGVTSRPFTTLLGCGFSSNDFFFLFKNETGGSFDYFIERGKVYFDQFTPGYGWEPEIYSFAGDIEKQGERLFVSKTGLIFLGLKPKSEGGNGTVYNLFKRYASSGECDFNYVNGDVEGLTGFDIEVYPRWLAFPGNIDFGFSLRQKTGEETAPTDPAVYPPYPRSDLAALMAEVESGTFQSDYFTVSSHYNELIDRDVIHFEFKRIEGGCYIHFEIKLYAGAQESPSIHGLMVYKKVRAKIANVPGSTLVIPIQGYVYDRTVTEISVQHVDIPIGRNGYFSTTITVENAAKTIPVELKCYNAAGDAAELGLTIEIVESTARIWDVKYAFDSDPPQTPVYQDLVPAQGASDFMIDTTKRRLLLSGKCYGLSGAVLGYKLYSTQASGNTTPLKQGIFATEKVIGDIDAFAGTELGPGYEAWTFADDEIELVPNEQRLVLYIENPGSMTYEYKSESGLFPVFVYSMDPSEQEIIFNADIAVEPPASVDGIQIANRVDKTAYERKAPSGTTPLYTFVCEDSVTGEIRALEQFDELLVRSYTPGLVFENGQSQTEIDVQPGNKFTIPFKVTMGGAIVSDFDIAVIPTVPVYNYLKKGLNIRVKKSFADTAFIPDFDILKPDNWTTDQKEHLDNIPIRFKFKDRTDVPVPHAIRAVFTMNFNEENEKIGYVEVLDSNYFCLRDEYGGILNLSGINKGKNRLQWSFTFVDQTGPAGIREEIMSSSYSGKEGCEDFTFTFEDNVEIEPTVIAFTPALSDMYYNNNPPEDPIAPVPAIDITKDDTTDIAITLNGVTLQKGKTDVTNYHLSSSAIRQGRNELSIVATNRFESAERYDYSFLYDSASPTVRIASVRMNSSYMALTQITVDVTEANFARAYIHYGTDIINAEPEVIVRGESSYLLVWNDIELLGLNPATSTVKVETLDRAGKSGSDTVDSFADIERPEEYGIFKQVSKLFPNAGTTSSSFGRNVSISGDYAILGNSADGNYRGSAYIFKHDFETNEWVYYTKLLSGEPETETAFGCSADISDDYAIIGAVWDNDKGDSSGSAYIFKLNHGNGIWEQQAKLTAWDGTANDRFGNSVAIEGDWAIIGASDENAMGSVSGSCYIFKKQGETWSFYQKIFASDGQPVDRFGWSISMWRYYAIISAYGDDDNGSGAGSAYMFKYNPSSGLWEQTSKILAPDGYNDDYFGYNVSICEKYAIVGSFRHDAKGNDSGAAYIYGPNGEYITKLLASDGQPNDNFGYSVSITEKKAIVGAHYDDNRGSVYIFEYNEELNKWDESSKILAKDGFANDNFGNSIAQFGDFVIIGAPGDDDMGTNTGSAYVFRQPVQEKNISLPIYSGQPLPANESNYAARAFKDHTKFAPRKLTEKISVKQEIENNGNLLCTNYTTQKILANDGEIGDIFGSSVSISGDYAIIGAPFDIGGGSAYIFHKTGYGWIQEAKLTEAGSLAYGSVSIWGDYAIVGDANYNGYRGAAYIYHRIGTVWTRQAMLTDTSGMANDYFGGSVSINGDYAIVGERGDDSNKGSAFIFVRSGSNWSQQAKLTESTGSSNDSFGASVSISGDYSIVGIPNDDEYVPDSGSAIIYHRIGTSWIQPAKILQSFPYGGQSYHFGESVSISGDYAIIGIPGDGHAGNFSGAANIYHRTGENSWAPQANIIASDGAGGDWFGYSVSISGDYAIVGANQDDDVDHGQNCGSSYIYKRSDSSWNQVSKFIDANAQVNDMLGSSVSISNQYTIIGTPWDRDKGAASGSAFITKPNPSIFSTNTILDEYQKKYLVFQVEKNPSTDLTTAEDMEEKIVFETYGLIQNPGGNPEYSKVSGSLPFPILSGHEYYLEGLQYMYYVVEIQALKDAFGAACSQLIFGQDDIIFDRGVLSIKYNAPLNSSPFDIFLAGETSTVISELVVYDNAYADESSIPQDGLVDVADELRHQLLNRTVTFDQSTNEMTLAFWLRIEDEDATDSHFKSIFKQLLVFKDNLGTKLYGIGYMGTALDFLDFTSQGSGESLLGSNLLSLTAGLDESNTTRFDSWNYIVLELSAKQQSIGIKVFSKKLGLKSAMFNNVSQSSIESILSRGASFCFGADVQEFNTGFYSIANPYCVNRILSENEISRLGQLYDANPGGDRRYRFANGLIDFGENAFDLHKIGGADYFAQYENSYYTEPGSVGSLKCSSAHPNLLKVTSLPQVGSFVILRDAETCITHKLTLAGGTESFTLNPDLDETGRYYFGDKSSNYSLGLDKFYSISGNVLSIEPDKKAFLVMRINGIEQNMSLVPGRFHFIYDNSDEIVPAEVKVYIETTGVITLGTDLILNEGDYPLPITAGLESTAASTSFTFGLSGSIDFWYKPFAVNNEGFVDYPIVLLDSEWIRISADVSPNGKDAVYYALVKSSLWGNEGQKLLTNVNADYAWRHFQLAYDFEHKVVYFYIDGKIAAMKENIQLTQFGTIGGIMSESDNVFIGCDKAKSIFAEGYIDDLRMSRYYSSPIYHDNKPVSIFYDPNGPEVALHLLATNPSDITAYSYILEATDGTRRETGSGFPIDTSALPAGRYSVFASMKIKGHNYSELIAFNVENKPRFNLTSRTPFVFAGELKGVHFTYDYDHSYVFNTDILKFVGAATRITYNGKKATAFLVQDFIEQDTSKWLCGIVDETGAFSGFSALYPGNDGKLTVIFPDTSPVTDMGCQYEYFYFTETFPGYEWFDVSANAPFIDGPENDTIPIARLTEPRIEKRTMETEPGVYEDYEYMVTVGIEGNVKYAGPLFSEITIEYEAKDADNETIRKTGEVGLSTIPGDPILKARIYYDDMFGDRFGTYDCILRLMYKNIPYATREVVLNWKQRKEMEAPVVAKVLSIEEFTLLMLNKTENKADLYLQVEAEETGNIDYAIEVKKSAIALYSQNGVISNQVKHAFLRDIPVPKGTCTVRVMVSSEGLSPVSSEIDIGNFTDAPSIALTNSVNSEITYNDVFFSWKGYYKGEYLDEIAYSYNFDGTGWSTANSEWRSVRFYSLDDGPHNFQVKSIYQGTESTPIGVRFFVDVSKPDIHEEKIMVEKLYNKGVAYAVRVTGAEGAITDASLRSVNVGTGQKVTRGANGAFSIGSIPLVSDGTNSIVITAVDKVGNYTDYTIDVENKITDIIFPAIDKRVKFSPMTIVGRIDNSITSKLDIYLRDPFCATGGNGYSGWKKAVINQDRTFFIENVFVNPGTKSHELLTQLELASVFETGEKFSRTLNVFANEILLPIELMISTHAVEGEGADTEVIIDCRANVEYISSWSIDFDGDGVYDAIDPVDNPLAESSKTRQWIHTYSSIGLVRPRVRAITTDGNFFSVSDTLIIHEKIKEASNKLITSPLSVSSFRMPDKSHRIFVLHEEGGGSLIDVFHIGRNDTYISNKLYSIDLSSLGITGARLARAIDSTRLLVGANDGSSDIIYELVSNEFGNFMIATQAHLEGAIKEITFDEINAYVSYANRNYFTRLAFSDKVIVPASSENVVAGMHNTVAIGANSGVAKDNTGMLVADYYNQRVVRLSNSLSMLEQFGSIGTGETQFLTPSIVRSFENRIFIFDETRRDIQIFDRSFTPVCTLAYSTEQGAYNYLAPEFFTDIADIDVITKTDGNMLYYYALLLSRSTGKLAFLRLPQWEELRARVRNNKITYIHDGEVFTAKPDGGDLRKILSSDSLPRIEGALDYPSLSPDGKILVFTSRLDLYIGVYEELLTTGDEYAYDRVYTYDIEKKTLKKLQMDSIRGFEIERPQFNSNGNRLIFSARGDIGTWQLYTYDFETSMVERVFESDENARFPYYSPDDRFIVFTTDYDGDEDITIIDTQNLNMRVSVTANNARDSYPVWVTVFPDEISNDEWKIESKIGYVSEIKNHKGVYNVYLSRQEASDIRVVTSAGTETGGNPDSAAIEITPMGTEGDYPCFTGDGTALVFEYFDGNTGILKKYDFTEEIPENRITDMADFGSALRPAGMKNMITNFVAKNTNGDEIELSWNRYTDKDIFYTIQFAPVGATTFTEKKVFSQTGSYLKGLEMGQEYGVRVCIVENGETVAASQWKRVEIPVVVAKPSYEIDSENPYLVHLHAWRPSDADDAEQWRFAWIIDNDELLVQGAQDFAYEYGTSGQKTIQLKAYIGEYQHVSISAPFAIDIKSDIDPFIEPVLAEDSSYIDLSCEKSKGSKINFATATWTITGPGGNMIQLVGPTVTAPLANFTRKINVMLTLQRIPVSGQQATDTVVETKTIDLDLKELVPIISAIPDEEENRLIKFSGQDSIGNIDWYRARWLIYADNAILYQTEGVSTFDFLFPERNEETVYTVSLTIPRRNDGATQTVSQFVYVEPTPIECSIDYEILTLKVGTSVVGYKVLFDCTKSKGSDIDFFQARWSVPVAGMYGEQAVQMGPTSTYNLVGINEDMVIEVALTLSHRGGTDPITTKKLITIKAGETGEARLFVNPTTVKSSTGTVLMLDVYKSTGPNIDWERTEWLIDSQYAKKGPVARYDVPASSSKAIINYTCTLYRFGSSTPQTVSGHVDIESNRIRPFINPKRLSNTAKNAYMLDVLQTEGVNIDWEKTLWYIHDGNQDVVVKQGAFITHAFSIQEEKMGYPVIVEMFFKEDSRPFIGYESIDVEGDAFIPVIKWSVSESDETGVDFSAESSVGSNIDWTQAKWTFMDSAETAFGPNVMHTFPATTANRDYVVMLTLFRRLANGQVESKTARQTINIASSEITPVMKAKVYGNYLVLSAEDSQGKGLLLDRAVWLFPGKGDSTSYSEQYATGKLSTKTTKLGASASVTAGSRSPDEFCWAYYDIHGEAHAGIEQADVEYTDANTLKEKNDSFSSANSQTGIVCRRYVQDPNGKIIVTLHVYRMTKEGGAEGKSITVNVDLAAARASATSEGVSYE